MIRVLSAGEAQAGAVRGLGLDPEALDLSAVEVMASALRRAAGFLCPCAASTLVRAVARCGDGIVGDNISFKESIETTLEAIVGLGDLIEMSESSAQGGSSVLLYCAHPSFVRHGGTGVVLLGVAPEHQSSLPEELELRVEYVNHVRRLSFEPGEDLPATLETLGLQELSFDTWLRMPPRTEPGALLQRLNRLLDVAGPSGDMPGLTVIDPSVPVGYYRGRWKEPRHLSGRFVGRRPQAYGADLWCYVELQMGNPLRFIDFPARGSRVRGCDEAWHAQMAIDAHRGSPQRFRVLPGPSSSTVVELFGPIPMWAQRALDSAGSPTPRAGCLFAYRLMGDIAPELDLLRNALWLTQIK